MEDYLRFEVPPGAGSQLITKIVADDYALKTEARLEAHLTFYDTFDWRLFNKCMVLCQTRNELVVRQFPTGAELVNQPNEPPPDFVRELSEGSLKRIIAPVVGDRRLFEVSEVFIRTVPYRLLNADGKTVAHLQSVEVRAKPGVKAALIDAFIALIEMRGFSGHFRRIASKFEQACLTASLWQETFQRIIAAQCGDVDRQPGRYSARPDYRLVPGTRADEATKIILRQTLAVMRANEAGIKADWDAEFLHDFRTAVRRTRSALSQIPDVFNPEITENFKEKFSQLGEWTNRLRNLDVLLTSESDYRALLPDVLGESIAPLFDYLRKERNQALQEIIDELNSAHYSETMQTWEDFLKEPVPDAPSSPNSTLPVDVLARRQIYKRYQQVIKDGNQIHVDSPDEFFHRLRIDCKKLRYLTEFFASLFPEKEMEALVERLKTLQDDLGLFNDLSVQKAYLMHISETLPADDARSKRGLVAIGQLVEKLTARHQAIKPELARSFAEFAAKRNRQMYRQLFKKDAGYSEP